MRAHANTIFLTIEDPNHIDNVIRLLDKTVSTLDLQIFHDLAEPYIKKIKNAINLDGVFSQLYKILKLNKYPNVAIFKEILKKCIDSNRMDYAYAIYLAAKKSKVIATDMYLDMMEATATRQSFILLQVICQDAVSLTKDKDTKLIPSQYHPMINYLIKLKEYYESNRNPDFRKAKWFFDEACRIYKASGIQPNITIKKNSTVMDFHGFNQGSTYVGLHVFLQIEQEKINQLKENSDKNNLLTITDVTLVHGGVQYDINGKIVSDSDGKPPVKSGVYAFLRDIERNKKYEMRYTSDKPNDGCVICNIIKERPAAPLHQPKPNKPIIYPTFLTQQEYFLDPNYYAYQTTYSPKLFNQSGQKNLYPNTSQDLQYNPSEDHISKLNPNAPEFKPGSEI